MRTGRSCGWAVIGLLSWVAVVNAQSGKLAGKWQALQCPAPALDQTWGILERDGANRKVEPYLSSLVNGEASTGMISSPPFLIDTDSITFTICGHDGDLARGGLGKNYIALVDARKGEILIKTPAPRDDAMHEQRWDVRTFKGLQVRIELRDEIAESAFAWFGVGRINAGSALQVDFRMGMPRDWAESRRTAEVRYELLADGVPFQRVANAFTLIPRSGAIEIPCGFNAERLYFLGGTVASGKPLHTYGGIELHYRTGSPDVFPLMCGFTLDASGKRLSPSQVLHLHPSADPYQAYLVLKPRSDVIEKIRLVSNPGEPFPRITGITCQTDATAETLMPLPAALLKPEETAWIEVHSIAAESLDLNSIILRIREAHKLPAPQSPIGFRKHRLDPEFRSEGVAVADLNSDGRLDIAAGNVYYAGPDWKRVAMQGEPRAFNRLGYSDAFLCYADDLNGDHATDLIIVGFPGQQTYWLANPGQSGGAWKKHLAIPQTGNESPAYINVDGDGRRELVFMNGDRCSFAQPDADPTQPWKIRAIARAGHPSPGHGLGVGDLNGDGRRDVVIPDGWWEQPDAPRAAWPFHPARIFGGAQLCVADFDGDGDADVLGSSPHAYGIAWSEQTPDGFTTREIDNTDSQTHAIAVADMNGDGLLDFVTGKRFWAHNGHDPGSYQPSVLCWYEQQRSDGTVAWTKHLIDAASGVGLHLQIVDVNGDGRLDIVTSNKHGVFYFEQSAGSEASTR